jgi:hypothetical protein
MTRLRMAENVQAATKMVEQGHVRCGTEVVTDVGGCLGCGFVGGLVADSSFFVFFCSPPSSSPAAWRTTSPGPSAARSSATS